MAKLSLATFDTPLVFIAAMILVIVPVIALMAALARRVGVPTPAAAAGVPGA